MKRNGVLFVISRHERFSSLCNSPELDVTDVAYNFRDAENAMANRPETVVITKYDPISECLAFIRKYDGNSQVFIVHNCSLAFFYPFVQAGVSRFFTRKADKDTVLKAIISASSCKDNNLNPSVRISDILLDIGISARYAGFTYLRECILIAVYNPGYTDNIARNLYGAVAQKYGVSIKSVERSVRYSIVSAYQSERIYRLNQLFGKPVLLKPEKPTNNDLISIISDRVILELY